MSKGFVIAIDGPAAAGKGTISPILAKKLNGFYLYTGAMYRCLALLCIENGIATRDEEKVLGVLPKLNIKFDDEKVFLNGIDVTQRIKKEDVAMGASDVAAMSRIRKNMVPKQQEAAREVIDNGKVVIAEGRDTATRIFPNADLKIFLTATPQIRAKRRLAQLEEIGEQADYEKVLNDVYLRDEQDSNRETDPLVKNPKALGYVILDNSQITEEETVEKIIKLVKNKK